MDDNGEHDPLKEEAISAVMWGKLMLQDTYQELNVKEFMLGLAARYVHRDCCAKCQQRDNWP